MPKFAVAAAAIDVSNADTHTMRAIIYDFFPFHFEFPEYTTRT